MVIAPLSFIPTAKEAGEEVRKKEQKIFGESSPLPSTGMNSGTNLTEADVEAMDPKGDRGGKWRRGKGEDAESDI